MSVLKAKTLYFEKNFFIPCATPFETNFKTVDFSLCGFPKLYFFPDFSSLHYGFYVWKSDMAVDLDYVVFFWVDVDVTRFLFSYGRYAAADHFCSYYHYFYQKKFSDGSSIQIWIFGYQESAEKRVNKAR